MIWKCAIFLFLGAALSLLAAETNPPPVKVIAKGAFSGIQEAKQIVVTNQTQWAELWNQHTAKKEPRTAPPEVDFSKKTVVFVSMGQKRSGGYSVEIADVHQRGGKTEVIVKERTPKPGGFQLTALTAPFVIAAIPRTEGKVEIRIENH